MLNEIIRKKRRELEITQEELAKKVGINRQYLNGYETGKHGMSIKNIEKIFNELKIT